MPVFDEPQSNFLRPSGPEHAPDDINLLSFPPAPWFYLLYLRFF